MTDIVQVELIRSLSSIFNALILGIPATIGAFLSWRNFRQSQTLSQKVDNNHKEVNGRMTELLALKGEEGQEIGRKKEVKRAEEAKKINL